MQVFFGFIIAIALIFGYFYYQSATAYLYQKTISGVKFASNASEPEKIIKDFSQSSRVLLLQEFKGQGKDEIQAMIHANQIFAFNNIRLVVMFTFPDLNTSNQDDYSCIYIKIKKSKQTGSVQAPQKTCESVISNEKTIEFKLSNRNLIYFDKERITIEATSYKRMLKETQVLLSQMFSNYALATNEINRIQAVLPDIYAQSSKSSNTISEEEADKPE
jgi:hypothetical protein